MKVLTIFVFKFLYLLLGSVLVNQTTVQRGELKGERSVAVGVVDIGQLKDYRWLQVTGDT